MLVSFEEMDLCTPAEYQKILNIDVWLTDKIKQFEESSKVYRVKATDSSLRIQIVNEIFIARKMNCSTSLTHVDLVISSFSKFYIITFKELPNC